MNTSSYTDNTIFTNNQINAICDFIFLKLTEEFPPEGADTENDFVFEHFILSGRASKQKQRLSDVPVKNIIFQCDNNTIYEWFALNYQNIFEGKGMIFKERIILYPFGYYFEIWFSNTALNPITSTGINIQNVKDIPLILL